MSRKLFVRFSEPADITTFVQDAPWSACEWVSVHDLSRSNRAQYHEDDISPIEQRRKVKRLKQNSYSAFAGRRAIAKALSLSTLLGIPALTSQAYSAPTARFIADTGCGKDMVGSDTFSRQFMNDNSWRRSVPLHMQTANGPLTLDTEVDFRIRKFGQTASAIVGKDTPNLLSVGHRVRSFLAQAHFA